MKLKYWWGYEEPKYNIYITTRVGDTNVKD